ncbi:MAG: GIDE domain-containing protein, partial [Clostridia bacterium]
VLEINGVGCDLDIPKTFDRFEPKNNLSNYRYFNSFSVNRFGAETLGFKMTEETIEENQNLYVIGEAFRVGDTIHIGKPEDKKKPFIVTTKSEEDLINKSNQNAMFSLVGGIVAIIVGIIFIFVK